MRIDLTLGGSERGYSWYLSLIRCPRTVWYRETKGDAVALGKGKAETGRLNSALVGTLFHHLAELFYARTGWDSYRESGAEFFVSGEPLTGYAAEEQEAQRLISAYAERYMHREFSVEGVEETLRCENFLGAPLLTGRVDLVIRWLGGPLPGSELYLAPGIYLVDHKTAGSTSSTIEHDHEAQLWVYQLLWNALHPDGPRVAGAIVNEVIKTKEPKFRRILVRPPTEPQIDAIKETLARAVSLLPVWQQRVVSDETCVTQWGVCPYRKECLG